MPAMDGSKNFGVRLLKISGEKLFAQPQLVNLLKEKLRAKMEELSLCEDQLYNADESGLYWKQLPDKAYGIIGEKCSRRKDGETVINFHELLECDGNTQT